MTDLKVLLIVGTIRLPPEKLDEARPVMARMVAASRAEAGCLSYSYAEDVLEPGLIHVTELWRDRAALKRHFASEHLKAWRAAWPALGFGERNLSVFRVGAPRPI
jgi:quinol monooxygenase YgiN